VFTFDENLRPPDIEVRGHGESSFTLQHKYLTGTQRAAVIEATSQSLAYAMELLWQRVINVTGVVSPDGNPIGMHYEENGQTKSRLDLFMGRVPFGEQCGVMIYQLAMNGVDVADVSPALIHAVARGDEKVEAKIKEDLQSFLKQPGGAAGTPSTGSATGEPSPS